MYRTIAILFILPVCKISFELINFFKFLDKAQKKESKLFARPVLKIKIYFISKCE
jgi:hypothetical protein